MVELTINHRRKLLLELRNAQSDELRSQTQLINGKLSKAENESLQVVNFLATKRVEQIEAILIAGEINFD